MQEKVLGIIEELKVLTFHVKVSPDENGVLTQAVEFPEAYEYAKTQDESIKALVHTMKDYAQAYSEEFNRWKNGREHEIPYLLKIFVSSEEELLSCLKLSK